MKLFKSKIVLIFLFLNLFFVVPGVLSYFKGQYLFSVSYYEYLFGNGYNQYSPWYTWREYGGMPNTPSSFDIFYYWPQRILYVISNGNYFTWILYLGLVFFVGNFFAASYIRRIVPSIGYTLSFFIGLIYTAFISLNYESSFVSLKLASSLLPMALVVFDELYKLAVQRGKIKTLKFFVLSFIFPFIFVDLVISDPRSAIAFLVLLFAHLFCLNMFPFKLKSLMFKILIFVCNIVLLFILLNPSKVAHDYTYTTSAQYSAPIADSVLVEDFRPSYLFLFPHPYYPWTLADAFVHGVFFVMVIVSIGLMIKKKTYKFLLPYLTILIVAYSFFLNRTISETLTLYIPYGQLFRSWRIAQYVAPFILMALLVGVHEIFLLKHKLLTLYCYGAIFIYFILSLSVVWTKTFAYSDKKAITDYQKVNNFLETDSEHYKVIWTPEMGWFGNIEKAAVGPYWLHGNDKGQGFPEQLSIKPSYWHYYNNITDFYTWLASGAWLSETQVNKNVMELYSILGVKYVIYHNDIESYELSLLKGSSNNLPTANNAENVYQNNILTVYKNTSYKGRIWTVPITSSLVCDNGLSCLSEVYQGAVNPYNVFTILADTQVPEKVLKDTGYYFSSTSNNPVEADVSLIQGYLQSTSSNKVINIFPSKSLAELKKVACLSDTHHALYHPYFSKMAKYKYDQSIDPAGCNFILTDTNDFVSEKTHVLKGEYVVAVRYFKSPKGGKLNINFDGNSYLINTLNTNLNAGNGFYYYTFNYVADKDKDIKVNLISVDKLNMINSVSIIPKEIYAEISNLAFSNKKQLTVADIGKVTSREQIVSAQYINPTIWEFNLNQPVGTILNFSEAYNPGWELKVYTDSGEKTFKSFIGYGMINSFYIDTPVNGKAVIYYTPQGKYVSSVKTALALTVVVIFIEVLIIKLVTYARKTTD